MDTLSKIVGYALWVIAVWHAVTWAWGIRSYYRTGRGPHIGTCASGAAFVIAIAIAIRLGSPFHLLWVYPSAWAISMLPIFWRPLGSPYGRLVTIGCNHAEAERCREVLDNFRLRLIRGEVASNALREIAQDHPGEVEAIGKDAFVEEVKLSILLKGSIEDREISGAQR